MSKRRRPRGGYADRHVRLHHWLLRSPAWRSLDCYARALLVEMYGLYNGTNNGEIPCSVRQAAEMIDCCKATAEKTLVVLQKRGFIKATRKGTRTRRDEERIATSWLLTEHPNDLNGREADKTFMRWRTEADDAEIKSTVLRDRTHRPPRQDGTQSQTPKNTPDRPTRQDAQADFEAPTVLPDRTYIVNHPEDPQSENPNQAESGRAADWARLGGPHKQGAWLKAERERLGMTHAEIASVINLTEWQVANVEAGRAQLSPSQRKRLRERFAKSRAA